MRDEGLWMKNPCSQALPGNGIVTWLLPCCNGAEPWSIVVCSQAEPGNKMRLLSTDN
jgi:chemotaxis methyl-accepting protein methylase